MSTISSINRVPSKTKGRLGFNVADVNPTLTELLACYTTPITVVPAPGAGFVHIVHKAVFIWNAGSAALDTASNLGLKYTDGSGAIITVVEAASTYDTTDLIRIPAMTVTAITGVANAAIVFSDSAANPGTGTGGRLRIVCFYSTLKTEL